MASIDRGDGYLRILARCAEEVRKVVSVWIFAQLIEPSFETPLYLVSNLQIKIVMLRAMLLGT